MITLVGNKQSGKSRLASVICEGYVNNQKYSPTEVAIWKTKVLSGDNERKLIFIENGDNPENDIIIRRLSYRACNLAVIVEGGIGSKTVEDWMREIREINNDSLILIANGKMNPIVFLESLMDYIPQ